MNDKHIIFDLDGTLIDSKSEIISTYKKVFLDIIPPTPVDFSALNYSATLTSILQGVYVGDTNLIQEAKLRFADIYDHSSYEDTLLYPFVHELLAKLKEKDIICHIATNKRLVPTLNILKQKKMSDFFSSIKASDMIQGIITSKKEMVSGICKENKINVGMMIGDSIQDIESGVNSGLMTVAVGYGYETTENLLKVKSDYLIYHLSELDTILEKNGYYHKHN
jgi:phosphoglycolate phosphatase-like HAD superfamily hydrolase